MVGYTAALKRILRDAGCEIARSGNGDHEIWHSPVTDTTFTIDSDIKSHHTANQVLKQAGLRKVF